ncbi:MAG: hypothetical protein R3C45_02205 [Phycisphaerales bacterium]
MIAILTRLFEKHQTLSAHSIDQTEGILRATVSSPVRLVGSAYRLAGYDPGRDFSYVEVNRCLREIHPTLMDDAVQRLSQWGLIEYRGMITVACWSTVNTPRRWCCPGAGRLRGTGKQSSALATTACPTSITIMERV